MIVDGVSSDPFTIEDMVFQGTDGEQPACPKVLQRRAKARSREGYGRGERERERERER